MHRGIDGADSSQVSESYTDTDGLPLPNLGSGFMPRGIANYYGEASNNYYFMKWKTANGDILDIKDMSIQHLKNCRLQLMRRIIDPYDVVGDKFGGSFTEACILEENKRLDERIKEITLEINSR